MIKIEVIFDYLTSDPNPIKIKIKTEAKKLKLKLKLKILRFTFSFFFSFSERCSDGFGLLQVLVRTVSGLVVFDGLKSGTGRDLPVSGRNRCSDGRRRRRGWLFGFFSGFESVFFSGHDMVDSGKPFFVVNWNYLKWFKSS